MTGLFTLGLCSNILGLEAQPFPVGTDSWVALLKHAKESQTVKNAQKLQSLVEEALVFKDPRCIVIFNYRSHAGRFYRTIKMVTNSKFGLSHIPEASEPSTSSTGTRTGREARRFDTLNNENERNLDEFSVGLRLQQAGGLACGRQSELDGWQVDA